MQEELVAQTSKTGGWGFESLLPCTTRPCYPRISVTELQGEEQGLAPARTQAPLPLSLQASPNSGLG
jgi:hypothetical protein